MEYGSKVEEKFLKETPLDDDYTFIDLLIHSTNKKIINR